MVRSTVENMVKSMKEKYRFGAVIIIALIGALVAGLMDIRLRDEQKEASLDKLEPMRVAKYYWPGMYWIEIADKKGWFREAGLNIELVDTNSDYFRSLGEMAAGKLVDAHAFSLFDAISYNAKGADLVMIINADNSFGVEAVVAKKAIATLEALKGKTVGVTKNTYTEYILDVALTRVGLSLNDVVLAHYPVEKTVDAFVNSEVDAIVTWEPDVTKAINGGNGHILFDTSEVKGISPNGQVVHRSFIESRGEDVQRYVEVWDRTTTYIQKYPQEAYGIIADIYGTTWQEVEAIEKIDQIQNLSDNLSAFTIASGLASLHGSVNRMNRFLKERELIEKKVSSDDVLNDYFIHRLNQTKQ